MGLLYLVEPVMAIYCFASFVSYPLMQQYVYQRFWQDEFNSTVYYDDNISHCETNQSNPNYVHQKEVQKRASMFSTTLDLSSLIPSLLMALILVSYGDQHGRKASLLLPSIGALITISAYCSVSFFDQPLEILYISSVFSGFLGGFATFIGGCFSYIADIAKDVQKKNIRIAFIDMILGVSSGVAGITSGYIIRAFGFKWSFALPAFLHLLNILYILFILEETVIRSEFQQNVLSKDGFRELFSGVFVLFKNASCRKRVTISLLLFAFMSYLFTNFGAVSLFTLYELDSPLCWDPVRIGWGSALSTFCFVGSFLGIFFFTRCLKDAYIIFIGIASWIGGITMAAFSTTTVTMMSVRLLLLFSAMPLPVLRSMMSKVVLETEQGALFACIACLESLIGTLTLAVFNSIYSATVLWFHGFCFLLSAVLSLIPFGVVWLLLCIGHQERDHVLLINEESSTEAES
ncbi:solute carrier family 46 member 3 [Hyla sarda]|uniref:solute carrier family 46 member 3 n=1 Tax=Hyla sarda TaxID=327740 RepID=UPI0024C35B8E|nr:solute carrier family 46 member 3 [Hyla sarda]XP_056417812.1 solute carrier family 46 member 3 [Hyla sarda]XP_056417813.1 solute carrier family 46 member 3 [Hyla sarda]XP_056417814.1 solute carrier family 46 member 3 [Hyla sarda]XP_056417815.1 solute carrier family 46 member 3 [Hyla sarda]